MSLNPRESRLLRTGAKVFGCLGAVILVAGAGCSAVEGDALTVTAPFGFTTVLVPEGVERVQIDATLIAVVDSLDLTDERGEPTSPEPEVNVWRMTLQSDGRVDVDGLEVACLGFVDCVEGAESAPFGLAAKDPIVMFRFQLPAVVDMSLKLRRTSEEADVVFRGGRFEPLDVATCTEVDAAGSLDPWQTEIDALCAAIFLQPTGSWVCDGEDVDIQCDRF